MTATIYFAFFHRFIFLVLKYQFALYSTITFMYHSIGNTFIHVRHIFNSHIAKLSMLLSKFQIFEFAFWDIENSLFN